MEDWQKRTELDALAERIRTLEQRPRGLPAEDDVTRFVRADNITYVDSANPTTNYTGATRFYAKLDTYASAERQILIAVDGEAMAALDASWVFDSAWFYKLYLLVVGNEASGLSDHAICDLNIAWITTAWDADTVTWNTKPAYGVDVVTLGLYLYFPPSYNGAMYFRDGSWTNGYAAGVSISNHAPLAPPVGGLDTVTGLAVYWDAPSASAGRVAISNYILEISHSIDLPVFVRGTGTLGDDAIYQQE